MPINNLNKSLEAGNSDASKIGNPIVLLSTYTGGMRYKMQNYLDTMALCKAFGYPDLFITFTCNPKWPEIKRFVQKHNVSAEDMPDVLTRPEDIDRLISAEIPDEQEDLELYKLVSEQMMHGPCGPHNMSSTCMKKKVFSKKFLKDYTEKTYINENGYAIYKRPDNNRTIVKNGIHLDNRYVVPHNPLLMKKFQAHINIEWCNQNGAIKYLFKYINKSQDRVTVAFENEKTNDNTPKRKDEIKEYYDCRYISACEVAWRLYKFPIHYQYPPVQRLSFHLPDEQPIVFEDDEVVEDLMSRGRRLKDIHGMPLADYKNKEDWTNVLIQEELNFKKYEMKAEHASLYSKMTDKQIEVYNTIMEAIDSGKGGIFSYMVMEEHVKLLCGKHSLQQFDQKGK
ncbi:hypothetical protein Tco_0925409 [Tanacetum coccineum]|uniref:Helitron helicase-like domain-containing protein n=1 Tax=Tanacetum coccineum TaxID=301880 RepID=A0ABQ5D7Z8_9ASTR